MDDLVTADWLADALGAPDLRVLDASYHPLDPGRDAAAEFRAGHVAGARFLDLATLADGDDPLPSMAPPPAAFARRMARLGVAAGDRVVLYDDAPHHTAARAWWLLRLYGARRVAILDGGLAAWCAAGLSMEASEGDGPVIAEGDTGFGDLDAGARTTFDAMRAIVAARGPVQIVDARGAARFTGAEPDPRPGVAPGHMPGALNLPYAALFEADGRWKRGDALAAAFAAAGVDPARPAVFTCGSGITAAVDMFAAHRLGGDRLSLYDGSWSEWGADPTTPKEVA